MADRNRTTSIGQRFSNLAQWTMQKFGRAEETKLEPEFVARVHKFNSTKKELNALLKAALAFHNAKLKLHKANENFHDALAMTGSHAKASAEAVSATQSYVTAGRQLDVEEAKFNESYKNEIVEAIQALLGKEVKECDSALKSHSTAHLEYDACKNKYKKMVAKPRVPTAKKQALEEELKYKAKVFNDLGHQVVNLTSIVETRKNKILHENLERFMVAQQEFFTQASKYMLEGDTVKTKLDAARDAESETKAKQGSASAPPGKQVEKAEKAKAEEMVKGEQKKAADEEKKEESEKKTEANTEEGAEKKDDEAS